MADDANLLDGLRDLGRKLKKSKLPDLAGAVLSESPVGKVGRTLRRVREVLGVDSEEPGDLAEALAGASPEQLAELRRIEAELRMSEGRELTARHEHDMLSDSWLSKNIRPMALMALLVVLFVYSAVAGGAAIWGPEMGEDRAGVLLSFGSLLADLATVAVGFYFGSRGVQHCVGHWCKGSHAETRRRGGGSTGL